ncbi:hypothetical protein Taro_042925 [Colocasia esculenta]|uniref:ABC transporter domain-containing protein n=1 Tax=Colocasia esculenta TaxID=4460 RepID=A0A843WQT8_COLES|nr:hypothetical protein [Colocasia esculenta]
MSDGMGSPSAGLASFSTQANALLRKNLTFQLMRKPLRKRNIKTNLRLVLFPVVLCVLLLVLQKVIDGEFNKPKYRCGCRCIDTNGDGKCENVCAAQYSSVDQVGTCAIPSPPEWPALLQVPRPQYRAVNTGTFPSADLPDESCRKTQSCPATILFTGGNRSFAEKVKCVQGLSLWRNSPSVVNDELYKGFRQSNTERKINEILAAYDFLNSDANNYNVRIWYNSTYKNDSVWQSPSGSVRVPRSLNVMSNAYLHLLAGDGMKVQLEFIKEMPKPATKVTLDFSSLLGATFFNWVIEFLLPVILTYLVYEKQHKLRLMMKMHGLGDGPYWVISYSYFLFISAAYMLLFVLFGSLIGLKFFRLNDYSIQFVFFFIYINLQIVLAFLAATFFSDVKTAQAIGYIYIFGSGLLAGYLFVSFVQDATFSMVVIWELLHWMLTFINYYQREVVQQLLVEPNTGYAMVCNNLRKVYPGRDGNPDKLAVGGLSLALPVGECFGMLGPNGAGKTSFINMMIGLTKPTAGDAYVQGFDIKTDMDKIYTSMGVCPQHDMLWEMLTGREHLLFYGRLKNLKGSALSQAVEESLKSVNLFYGGVGDKQAGKYSGGMKRRLSVAISLMGDPKVVYMDEPSTGLDPASRNNLWNVVKRAKQNRAIILTSISITLPISPR